MHMMKKILSASFQKADAPRTVRATISSGARDRDNDVINPKGWRFGNYMQNPIVLWSHDRSVPAIARTLSVRVVGGDVVAECEFPPAGIHDLADMIHDLVAAGFIHSTSVGFLPIKYFYNEGRDGHDFEEQELLEWSFVNIPSNYEAQVRRCLGGACDRSAVEAWVKSAKSQCGCGGEDYLDIADSPLYLDIAEAEPVLEIAEPYAHSDDVARVAPMVARALAEHVRRETAAGVRSAINYMRGRVD